jgi:hypothetical protein
LDAERSLLAFGRVAAIVAGAGFWEARRATQCCRALRRGAGAGPSAIALHSALERSGLWAALAAARAARRDEHLFTALHRAVLGADEQRMCELVELGGPTRIDLRCVNGNTPLLYACSGGRLRLVHILLYLGANANAMSAQGWTPLIVACHYGHSLVVRLLVTAGADLNAKGARADAWTPLNRALARDDTTLAAFLRAAGATRV